MKITGEQLYAMQAEEFNLRGVEVDSWGQLTATDCEVWNAMAERLGDRVFRVKGSTLPEEVSSLRVYGPTNRDIGSFEEVFGGFCMKDGETVLQALARTLPSNFWLSTPQAFNS